MEPRILNIAVLFDGAGLSRLGLEQAGHKCTGFEIDPAKHHLSKMVGSGNSILADVRDVDLSKFDAVWASPPCQEFSELNPGATGDNGLLRWSLSLPHKILWIENVSGRNIPKFGTLYNAAQFESAPRQIRTRQIGGKYRAPYIWREYRKTYLPHIDICPAVIATEYKNRYSWGYGSKRRARSRAAEWYGRPLSVREAAYHQGLEIPDGLLQSWFHVPPGWTPAKWRDNLFTAIGNGVPVYMARMFGEAYSQPQKGAKQLELFAATA
jgi:site-specific DNA-cytosine methylase